MENTERTEPSAGAGAPYRLLIVEDDAGIARGVAEESRRWGMEVRTAENFRDVLGEVRAFRPHLILLDISLPFFDGYHWCSRIRAESSVPILFLSSASDRLNMVMAMNLGADDFIAKPFDPEVLMAKVQALLRRAYDYAAAPPALEHRGAVLDTGAGVLLCGGDQDLPHPQRVPHPPVPSGAQGAGGEPGDADGAPVADGQLCGREHADGQREPPAKEAGRRRADGLHHHPGWHGLSDRGVRA